MPREPIVQPTARPQVVHVVLFRWRPGTPPAQVERVLAALRELPAAIPGILDLSAGANFSERAEGYETALVVRFADRASLNAYGPHPAHRRVVEELIDPIRAGSLAVDYEVAC
ncbi:MAG: Dabb family protein [Chthonomonadales bacterium]|nr:Dabb family protein [Chthonomonadales bacterium]